MARPRVFISSTYYDLKHIRASLETFIESLGFDPVLSEKGKIAYDPTRSLDKSCYDEVKNSNILVLVIGGRYGSEKSETKTDSSKGFFDRYESITKTEFKNAVDNGIPVYVLIERAVYVEYETYLCNKDNTSIKYAHVDSVNVFGLIEEILGMRQGNPFQQFDRFSDIQAWLREQWAGLFRQLLTRISSQAQIASLAGQVNVLTEINRTLKTYLEEVVTKIAPDDAQAIINRQEERLKEVEVDASLNKNELFRKLTNGLDYNPAGVRSAFEKATSPSHLSLLLSELPNPIKQFAPQDFDELLTDNPFMLIYANEIRTLLDRPEFTFTSKSE